MFKLNLLQILIIFIISYSCLVMIGWIWNIDDLTRIMPEGNSMQFITAFTFFLSGIALWLIDLKAKDGEEVALIILPAISILLLLIMGTLLVGGVFHTQTGITDLFTQGNYLSPITIPGMPSLPTILNFLFFSIACLLSLFESPKLKQNLRYLSIPLILFGAAACAGYLLKVPVLYYKFSTASSPMALNTAILFVLLGLGLSVAGRKRSHEDKS